MNLWSHALMSLFISVFISSQANGAQSTFKEEAERVFPDRSTLMPFRDLATAFDSIMLPKTKEKFNQHLSVMFRADFPKPSHPVSVLTNGFRCMYASMAEANIHDNEEEKGQLQLAALYRLLAFHKTSIAVFDKTLADEIPVFRCPNCESNAKKVLGLEKDHSEYKIIEKK